VNKVWTETEKLFIRDTANHMTDEQGSSELSRITGRLITVDAWRKQRQKLGIKKKPGRGICAVVEDVSN